MAALYLAVCWHAVQYYTIRNIVRLGIQLCCMGKEVLDCCVARLAVSRRLWGGKANCRVGGGVGGGGVARRYEGTKAGEPTDRWTDWKLRTRTLQPRLLMPSIKPWLRFFFVCVWRADLPVSAPLLCFYFLLLFRCIRKGDKFV